MYSRATHVRPSNSRQDAGSRQDDVLGGPTGNPVTLSTTFTLMLPRVVGSYELIIFGDGQHKEMDFHLTNLKAPHPFVDGILPTGIKEVRLKGGATLGSRLDGARLYITFNVPPSAATIIVELLYGKQD